jgi:hypothetical protein
MAARLMALCMALIACILTSACDPLIVAATYSGQSTIFELVSTPELMCPRLYRDGQVLYLLRQTPSNERTIQIYDPRTGLIYGALFSRTTLTSGVYGGQASSGTGACWLEQKGWNTGPFARIRYVSTPRLREQLNAAFVAAGSNEQTSRISAVVDIMSFLRNSGYVDGLSEPLPAYAETKDATLEEAKARLLRVSAESIADQVRTFDAVYAQQQSQQRVQKEQAEKQEQAQAAEWRQELEASIQRFKDVANRPKTIGMTICSSDNRVGYIDRIAAPRIQIQVVGQIVKNSFGRLDDYWIFRRGSYFRESRLVKEPRMVWELSTNWAECSYPVD